MSPQPKEKGTAKHPAAHGQMTFFQQKQPAPDHEAVIEGLYGVAKEFFMRGQYLEAIPAFDAVRTYRNVHFDEIKNPDSGSLVEICYWSAWQETGEAYTAIGIWREAVRTYLGLYRIFGRRLDKGGAWGCAVRQVLASQLAEQGKWKWSAIVAVRNLRAAETQWGPDDKRLVPVLDVLGKAMKALGRDSDSAAIIERSQRLIPSI